MSVELPASADQVPQAFWNLYNQGKTGEAAELADAAVQKWPEDPAILEVAQQGALSVGEFERAEAFGHQRAALADKAGNEAAALTARLSVIDVLLPQRRVAAAEDILGGLPDSCAADPQVKLYRAQVLRAQWRLDEAAAVTAEAYAALPGDLNVRLQQGWAQQHAGQYSAALKTYASIHIPGDPGRQIPEAAALACETLTFTGDWDGAQRRIDALLAEYPANFDVVMVAAMMALRRHNYEKALRLADQILSFYRGGTEALQLKVAALIRLRRIGEARQVIAEGLRRFPLSSGLLVYRGWASFASQDMTAASEDFTAAARRWPDDPTSHTGLGAVAFQLRDYDEALKLFGKVSRFSTIDPGAQANLALTLAAMGRDRDAVPHYEDALAHDPQNIQALICKSGVEFRRGGADRFSARMTAEQALSCDPADASCRVTMAAINSALGDYESARELLAAAIKDTPLYAQAYIELGILERKQGDNDKARVCLQQALDIDGQLAAGYRELAELELADERLDQAEATLRDGIDRMKPPDASLYASLGHVMRLIGEKTHSRECYEDAARQLATALRKGPDDHFFAEFELGVVQLRQGQYAAAQRTFAHILASDPDEPHAKVMLSRVNVLAAEPRAVRWWSLAIAAVAVAQAAAAWAAYLLHQLSATTFSALVSLFTGLFLVAALFPKLTKVALGGMKAELATVNYQPEMSAIEGPTPLHRMTTSAMVGAAFWFWP